MTACEAYLNLVVEKVNLLIRVFCGCLSFTKIGSCSFRGGGDILAAAAAFLYRLFDISLGLFRFTGSLSGLLLNGFHADTLGGGNGDGWGVAAVDLVVEAEGGVIADREVLLPTVFEDSEEEALVTTGVPPVGRHVCVQCYKGVKMETVSECYQSAPNMPRWTIRAGGQLKTWETTLKESL